MSKIWITPSEHRATIAIQEPLENTPEVHVDQREFEKRGFRTTTINLSYENMHKLFDRIGELIEERD